MESTFIAIGIASILAVVTLHQQNPGGAAVAVLNDAKALVAVRNWTFVLGPGFVVGVGNGLILGSVMYRSAIIPEIVWELSLGIYPIVKGFRPSPILEAAAA